MRWTRDPATGTSRIRITPQLIRVADDSHLWAETYDRTIDDVFKVQSEIAQAVVESLGVTLLPPERTGIEAVHTDSVDAYQAYLQGRYYDARPHFTYDDWARGMAAYQRAVELDPRFAAAWAKLARGHARAYYLPPGSVGRAPGGRGSGRRSGPRAGARLAGGAPRPRLLLDVGAPRLRSGVRRVRPRRAGPAEQRGGADRARRRVDGARPLRRGPRGLSGRVRAEPAGGRPSGRNGEHAVGAAQVPGGARGREPVGGARARRGLAVSVQGLHPLELGRRPGRGAGRPGVAPRGERRVGAVELVLAGDVRGALPGVARRFGGELRAVDRHQDVARPNSLLAALRATS